MYLSMRVSSVVLLPVKTEWKCLLFFKFNNIPWGVSTTSWNFTVFSQWPWVIDYGEKGDPETTTATCHENELTQHQILCIKRKVSEYGYVHQRLSNGNGQCNRNSNRTNNAIGFFWLVKTNLEKSKLWSAAWSLVIGWFPRTFHFVLYLSCWQCMLFAFVSVKICIGFCFGQAVLAANSAVTYTYKADKALS